jgi:hypothetical protein
MAYSRHFLSKARSLIQKAMKKIRVKRESDEKPSLATSPHLMINPTNVGLSGLGKDLAQEFADDLKAIIERQMIAWMPLSGPYKSYKRRMGLDPRILIATGRYVNSIQPIEQPDGTWLVSVPKEPLRPGSRYTLRDLARWLEYGTQNMPARPHWRPARNIWRTKIYQMKRRLHFDMVNELRKQGYR